jgi:hypothetical protein
VNKNRETNRKGGVLQMTKTDSTERKTEQKQNIKRKEQNRKKKKEKGS